MKKLLFVLGILLKLSIVSAQVKFIDVPKQTQTFILQMIAELKANPSAYFLSLYNTASFNRKSYTDSLDKLISTYENSIVPNFYAKNWKEINKTYLKDSTGMRQYFYLHGVHKNINIPLDSITILSYKEYNRINKNEFNEWAFNQNAGTFRLRVFIAQYEVLNNGYPLLAILFDAQNRLVAIVPFLYFDKSKGEVVGNFLKRYAK